MEHPVVKLYTKRILLNFLFKLSDLKSNSSLTLGYPNSSLNNLTLLVNSPLQLLQISLQSSYENLVFDQDNSFYLISWRILITSLLNSPLQLLQISLQSSYENLVFDQDNSFYLISWRILITSLLDCVLML